MSVNDKIAMLRQMRYIAAQKASGSRNDDATAEMIRAHVALQAFEAVAREGEPERAWNIDIDGHPLDPEHGWNKPSAAGAPKQTAEDNAKLANHFREQADRIA